ncbi:MAG: class I SAM-dependent methyltransferase [Lachnospiraceae bacterium]|nr:class I SAM-dependent methyltransferase [Lachnospiraceae bacterium]
MYSEWIKNLAPKPYMNLTWYQGKDTYSEGNIEDTVVRIIAENEPEKYVQAIADNYNWSTFYHLTHIRKNILNWYPFKEDASVLEIGCGMGAITGLLCDRCAHVTAVELSKRRATGTLLRCREKDNLEIIVGNLNDIEFAEKFDYITLIGVLEYQGSYTHSKNPYLDFLKKVKELLKPDGKLLIAIENQYGLKYWCGAREDHTGLPFEGMNQYTLSKKKVRTFSKAALDELVKASGFGKTYFYYPMPDYKMPSVVYSQDYLPKQTNMMDMQYYYVPDMHTLIAQESKIYADVIQNGVFEFFANSFLVECSVEGDLGEVPFATLSSMRYPEYQIGTRFWKQERVEKFPLYPQECIPHLEQILANEQALLDRGLKVWNSEAGEISLYTKFSQLQTLEEVLLEAYRTGDTDKVYALFDSLYAQILHSSERASWEENIMYTFDLDIEPNEEKFGVILKTGYLDMIPRNAFWHDGEICWFDQEWTLENVPARFVFYRALLRFYNSYEEVNRVISISAMVQRYDLLKGWKDFQKLEDLFSGVVNDSLHMLEWNGFRDKEGTAHITTLNRLLEK